MLIAQISDPHITAPGRPAFNGGDAVAAFDRAVDHLLALDPPPDAVLATGDLTADGGDDEYAALRTALARLPMPVYLIPGNHDRREGLRDAFADMPYWSAGGPFLHYVVAAHPVRLVALDTVVPGSNGGLMCAVRLDWLEARLAEAPDAPTMIFMHHPPARIGLAAMDGMWCDGGDAMAAVVRRHAQVVRVVCGHAHRPVTLDWAGTTLCVAPSSMAQLALDLAADATPRWSETEPPACLLHHWDAARGLATHVSLIPR